jgi:hypothetical protein
MSRLGAAFLTATILATTPLVLPASATEAPHRIARETAWGCRDKDDLLNLLFLGISSSFDTKLAAAVADGRCVYFKPHEDVIVVDPGETGLVRVQRGDATPAVYWTPSRNVR